MAAEVTFVGAEVVRWGMMMMASAIVLPTGVWSVNRRMLYDDLVREDWLRNKIGRRRLLMSL